MQRENTLYANAVGNFANGKSRIAVSFALADDHTLENLNTLFFTFFYFYVDFDIITRPKIRVVEAHLFFFKLLYFFHHSSKNVLNLISTN